MKNKLDFFLKLIKDLENFLILKKTFGHLNNKKNKIIVLLLIGVTIIFRVKIIYISEVGDGIRNLFKNISLNQLIDHFTNLFTEIHFSLDIILALLILTVLILVLLLLNKVK